MARTVFHTVRLQERPGAHRVNSHTVRDFFSVNC